MPLDEIHVTYLNGQSRGRLATVSANGSPQNKPVGYRYNADLGTIDIVGFDMERSAKYRNIGVNPAVSFVVDDAVGEGAENMRMLEIRGDAEQVAAGGSHLIRIHPRRVVSWNVDPGHPGLHTADVAGGAGAPHSARTANPSSRAPRSPARSPRWCSTCWCAAAAPGG